MIVRTISLYEVGVSSGEISLEDIFNGKTLTFSKSNVTVDHYSLLIIKGGWPEGIN